MRGAAGLCLCCLCSWTCDSWACASASGASENSSPASTGTPGMDPFTAAGAKAWATACSRPRPPRPRPPRRRRPRPGWLRPLEGCCGLRGCASNGRSSDWILEFAGVTESGRGASSDDSGSLSFASGAGPGSCSASKYAGWRGGGAGWSEASSGFFLRRCKRSRIHFRMHRF